MAGKAEKRPADKPADAATGGENKRAAPAKDNSSKKSGGGDKSPDSAGAVVGKGQDLSSYQVSSQTYRFAVVCHSNQNRSMEAHNFMQKKGYNIASYGTGAQVKMPGPTPEEPNVYDFGAETYDQMYKDLEQKDTNLYTQNGLLNMLNRNRGIKERPEKWQLERKREFDVVFTCEARVFDEVVKDMESRGDSSEAVHICGFEITDNHESATVGAHHIISLAQRLEKAEDLEDEIEQVLEDYQEETGQEVWHSVGFY